jgi:hypothetical protein
VYRKPEVKSNYEQKKMKSLQKKKKKIKVGTPDPQSRRKSIGCQWIFTQ